MCSHDEDVFDSRVYEAHLNIMKNPIVRLSHRRRSQSGLSVKVKIWIQDPTPSIIN